MQSLTESQRTCTLFRELHSRRIIRSKSVADFDLQILDAAILLFHDA